MRLLTIIFCYSILMSCTSHKEEKISLEEDVSVLADDTFNGRKTGTEGELQAAAYIEQRFEQIGLQPKGMMGAYTQTFTFRPSKNPHGNPEFTGLATDSTLTGTNVIGYKEGTGETTVVIGAHYDHLGMGGEGSLYREGEAIHNGADDNASGVALMLKLATDLQAKTTEHNYLFIAFSGEEMGLLGSNYFVKNPTIDTKKVAYMINLDMVGRLNEAKELAVHGVGTSPIFKQTLFANNDLDLKIAEHESGIGPSDHTSFYNADIPVLFFFTGQHEDYHKPSDDFQKLNYEGIETIATYIMNIIEDLEDNGQLTFRKTKNDSEDLPSFKVTLGLIPDYLYSGNGMRIDGISEDRPAQKAGLKKGDVMIKLGDIEITDVVAYTRALSQFEEGQATTVVVLREGETIEAEVVF
jgi:hypothetical protein